MPSNDQTIRTFQELANWYSQNGQAQMRDRFLVLAADALLTAGRADDAEQIRGRLLKVNPHHLLKPFTSFVEAMKSSDVKNYVEGLRKTYSPEKVAQLQESLHQPKPGKPAQQTAAKPEEDRPAKTGAAPSAEGLKVYRLADDKEGEPPQTVPLGPGSPKLAPRAGINPSHRPPPTAPPSRPVPPASGSRPLPPAPISRPAPPAAPPIQTRSASPLWSQDPSPAPWRTEPAEADPEPTPGAWLAGGLFWLLLLGGLALAGFTLARPFLSL